MKNNKAYPTVKTKVKKTPSKIENTWLGGRCVADIHYKPCQKLSLLFLLVIFNKYLKIFTDKGLLSIHAI